MGQLLVVLPVKQKLALPELIPDPLAYAFMRDVLKYFVNGSGIRCCTLRDFNRYSLGRDPRRDGKVGLQTEIPAYAGQQLIPDPCY